MPLTSSSFMYPNKYLNIRPYSSPQEADFVPSPNRRTGVPPVYRRVERASRLLPLLALHNLFPSLEGQGWVFSLSSFQIQSGARHAATSFSPQTNRIKAAPVCTRACPVLGIPPARD